MATGNPPDADFELDPITNLPKDYAKEERQTPDTDPDAIAASQKREMELADQLAQVEGHSPVTHVPVTRYQLQRGGNGLFTVMRRVDEDCADYEPDSPLEEYYENVCVCSSPFVALHIAQALETLHPKGDII